MLLFVYQWQSIAIVVSSVCVCVVSGLLSVSQLIDPNLSLSGVQLIGAMIEAVCVRIDLCLFGALWTHDEMVKFWIWATTKKKTVQPKVEAWNQQQKSSSCCCCWFHFIDYKEFIVLCVFEHTCVSLSLSASEHVYLCVLLWACCEHHFFLLVF